MKHGGLNWSQVHGRMGAVIFSVDGLRDTNPYTGRTWFGTM